MTDTDIRPALTPEQWSVVTDYCPDDVYGVTGGAINCSSIGSNRHALAAMALFRQPFGFTQRDVAMLVDHAGYVLDHGWSTEHGLILTLAARIAALLPSPEHE